MVIRLDLYNCLAKGHLFLVQMGKLRPSVEGHIVASLLHLEAGVQSPGVAFVLPGHGLTWLASRAHRGCSEHGLARGPERSVGLKGNPVPESGAAAGEAEGQRPLLLPLLPTSGSANQDTLRAPAAC